MIDFLSDKTPNIRYTDTYTHNTHKQIHAYTTHTNTYIHNTHTNTQVKQVLFYLM